MGWGWFSLRPSETFLVFAQPASLSVVTETLRMRFNLEVEPETIDFKVPLQVVLDNPFIGIGLKVQGSPRRVKKVLPQLGMHVWAKDRNCLLVGSEPLLSS